MVHTLIVGGGTAGCVLAARLSADPAHTVRVLEAGPGVVPPELRDASRMPIGPDSPWLWRYPATLADGPEVTAELVRGRVIGGSSSVNGSYFVRAPAADFAAWTKELGGDESWSFDAVLPAYRALERDADYGAAPGHGADGPIPVCRTADPAPVSRAFAAAARDAGFAELPDLNALPGSGPADGVGPVPCNVADGERVGTATAYLAPVLSRPNLTVDGGILVTRILFRGDRAIGVEYRRGTAASSAWADRIVLCAGAIESAALLLRSGVGPAADLAALGIPVVRDAPVGQWCTDHPEIGVAYRPGPQLPPRATVPLEFALTVGGVEIRPYTVSFAPPEYRMGVALMRPRGSGALRLRVADPDRPPAITQHWLAERDDRETLRAGVSVALDVLARMPGTLPLRADPDTPWLRANLSISQHLSGSCRMGTADDPRAVVDARLGVRGLTGLSVADLSVVPVPLGRGPQASVVMIAERAARYLTP
ncbi:mycofactocin dehydrogenase MftG [Nocardia puris]|uniref:Putative dehydrogenase (TIGR03970 family) n=1 Tax=Nocardia puris TaxID=208602 RepID=A0A366DLA3_9NOCA|nr:mycofactocin system GMC family oxidoreductase MftG [Nocardia puris]RBO90863.1 putative dehydrogenase (TIGR03970 family) [Nocardia puris]